jgi:hypothetical protein
MFLAATLAAGVPPSGAEPASDLTVTVRTYNYAQVADDSLRDARTSAGAIFGQAGIAVRWLDCRVPQSAAGAGCTEPLEQGSELILRLMNGNSSVMQTSSRIVALGESMLDRQRRGGVLMTVDLLPVRGIASQANADTALLLGRAIAHEIGHLLLGSGDHPREGLMRARWSQEELRGLKPSHWRFSPSEAARMRQNLAK